MQLFYDPKICPPLHTLKEEESKHCIRVLRLGLGDQLHITDGVGNLHLCQITDPNPKRCSVRVVETQAQFEPLPYSLTMAVAPTKSSDRYEWFLEKATEVGVSEFIPLESDHSERRTFKPERAYKVITSALKQSLKAYHPSLRELTPFNKLITSPFDGRKFIAHCDAPSHPDGKSYLASILRPGESALILIGPEGDFSPEEIALATENGFQEITLGPQRLRTETAAFVAVVMCSVVNGVEK